MGNEIILWLKERINITKRQDIKNRILINDVKNLEIYKLYAYWCLKKNALILDLHQNRIKKEIDEFESLLKEEKYW